MIKIVNLTPHPVTIIRHGRHERPIDGAAIAVESIPDPHGAPADHLEMTRITFPACAPADLPRAVEAAERNGETIGLGIMEIAESGDGQASYAHHCSLEDTGVVDMLGLVGVERLPPLAAGEAAFGVEVFRIVSIVTALGALAEGRTIVDLLIPCGQVRDAAGRIIGASGLAPASSLLSPLAERLLETGRSQMRGSVLAARVRAAGEAGHLGGEMIGRRPLLDHEIAAAGVQVRNAWHTALPCDRIDREALAGFGLATHPGATHGTVLTLAEAHRA